MKNITFLPILRFCFLKYSVHHRPSIAFFNWESFSISMFSVVFLNSVHYPSPLKSEKTVSLKKYQIDDGSLPRRIFFLWWVVFIACSASNQCGNTPKNKKQTLTFLKNKDTQIFLLLRSSIDKLYVRGYSLAAMLQSKQYYSVLFSLKCWRQCWTNGIN